MGKGIDLAQLSCEQCAINQIAERNLEPCPFAPRQRQRGDLLYGQDDEAQSAWFIKTGVVVLRRANGKDEGRGRAHAIRPMGTVIGLEGLARGQYSDSAEAGTPVTVCGIARPRLDAWLAQRHSPARTLLELTLEAEAQEPKISSLGSARDRISSWLSKASDIEGALALPRQTMAELIGVRAETLSRTLTVLAEDGLISVTRATIEILKPEALIA